MSRIASRIALTGLLACAMAPALARAADIAAFAPLTGREAWLGRAMEEAIGDNSDAPISLLDDACSTEGGATAAQTAISGGAKIVIGLPCIDAFDGAAPALIDAQVPMLVTGIRAADITRPPRGTNKDWTVFRIGPQLDDEAEVLGNHLATIWRDKPIAIIDDGTLYGRVLAEGVRATLEARALVPVFTDTFRPLLDNQVSLVRRIQRSGATHVVIGGEARDASVIAQAAEVSGISLVLAGGSYLIAPPGDGALPDGTIAVGVPDDIDLAAVAIDIAVAALDFPSPLAALRTQEFATPTGPIRFDAQGEPDRSFLAIHVFANGRPVPSVTFD